MFDSIFNNIKYTLIELNEDDKNIFTYNDNDIDFINKQLLYLNINKYSKEFNNSILKYNKLNVIMFFGFYFCCDYFYKNNEMLDILKFCSQLFKYCYDNFNNKKSYVYYCLTKYYNSDLRLKYLLEFSIKYPPSLFFIAWIYEKKKEYDNSIKYYLLSMEKNINNKFYNISKLNYLLLNIEININKKLIDEVYYISPKYKINKINKRKINYNYISD